MYTCRGEGEKFGEVKLAYSLTSILMSWSILGHQESEAGHPHKAHVCHRTRRLPLSAGILNLEVKSSYLAGGIS